MLFGVWISPSSDIIKTQRFGNWPTDYVKNEDVLHRVKEERNILFTVQLRKANWIGHIVHTNCLLKRVIGGKTEVTGRQERRRQQLLEGLKEAEDSGTEIGSTRSPSVGSRFGRGCGPVVSHYVVTMIQWLRIAFHLKMETDSVSETFRNTRRWTKSRSY